MSDCASCTYELWGWCLTCRVDVALWYLALKVVHGFPMRSHCYLKGVCPACFAAQLNVSVDALEAGLRFPLHPIIEECLRPKWGFQLEWSAHLISNIPPYLSEEEYVLVGRLKGILSSYQVIGDIIELWLVEAGLSLAPQCMNFISLFCRSSYRILDFLTCLSVVQIWSLLENFVGCRRSLSVSQSLGRLTHYPRFRKFQRVLRPDGGALKSSSRIWQDGATTIEFGRGVLHPQPVKELYTSPSKVLIDRAAKAMVW
ncbi:hypothetical protein BHE74_00041652, partial [Ensete ventricosum]